MKTKRLLFPLLAFLLLHLIQSHFLFAASSMPTTTRHKKYNVEMISASLALSLYNTGKIILIDSMSARAFKKSHALGAINLPYDGRADLERIRKSNLSLPKNKLILVYCK